MKKIVLGLFVVLLAAVSAAAAEATAEIGLRDRVIGTIVIPGESHDLTFFAPAETVIKPKVKAENKKVDPEVTLFLTAPGGDPTVPLEKGKTTLDKTGIWTISVQAGPGKGGMYRFDLGGKAPKKVKFVPDIPDGTVGEVQFGSLERADLSYTLKKGEALRLTGPGDFDRRLSGTKANSIKLGDAGEYTFRLLADGAPVKVTLKTSVDKPDRETYYLSPLGFGMEPEVTLVDPAEGLQDNFVDGITVEGEDFEDGALVTLTRGDETVFGETIFVNKRELTVGFNLIGRKTGKWDLNVINPSGGTDDDNFKIVKSGSVSLPAGVENNTEVWFLDFTDEFDNDLSLFGLQGSDTTVNSAATLAVQAYAVYILRTHFGLEGKDGRPDKEASSPVDISFVVDPIPGVAGAAGLDYNRIAIGGLADATDPSDNEDLPWGFVPVDTGNTSLEDIGGDDNGTAEFPTGEMDPADTTRTSTLFRQVFNPMRLTPLSASDSKYFINGFIPGNDEEVERFALIITTIDRLGREVAGILAHHIGRAMGIENTASGISSTPTRFGAFSEASNLSFEKAELDILFDNANPTDLPGKSSTLRAKFFPLVPGVPFLLPNAESTEFYSITLSPVGGRPDLDPEEDLTFEPLAGSVPIGFDINGSGVLAGRTPLLNADQTFNAGVFRFVIRILDRKTSGFFATYRLNLLVDLDDVFDSSLRLLAEQRNAQVISTP